MAAVNFVLLGGRLTRDVRLRELPSGTKVADLGLAVNEEFTNKAGEKTERTTFVDVTAWDKQAETCGQYLAKGSPVLVEGRLQMDEWTSKEGEKRSKIKVRADRVHFLGSPRKTEFGDVPAAPAAAEGPLADAESGEVPPDAPSVPF